MTQLHPRTAADRYALRLTTYAENTADGEADEFVIPEDLTALSDDELAALQEEATGHFDTLYGDGDALTANDLATLGTLTEGIEALGAEVQTRQEAAAERREAAEQLAARVRPQTEEEEGAEGEEPEATEVMAAEEDTEGEVEEAEPAIETQPESVAASAAKRERRISLGNVRSRRLQHSPEPAAPKTMKDVVLAADVPGFQAGQGLDWENLARAIDRRIAPAASARAQFERASKTGNRIREQYGVASIHKTLDPELTVTHDSPGHIDEIVNRAVDQKRLPGGSLVAAGGWCAPSETVYDFMELESDDGLISLPTIGITRGGINWTLGPSFADLYNATDFCFTEQNDINGEYAVDPDTEEAIVGPKPCYHVPCPPFQEARMGVCGLCITAGLLQSKGYPEIIARTVRGVTTAHRHKMSSRYIEAMVADSTAVTIPGPQAGATAPLLTSIEVQVEHYRYVHRLSRSTTLEGVFPYWVRGVVRADLARRLGLAMFDVTDAQVDGWFRDHGVSPQYVYDWQALDGPAENFTAWPETVDFLLYAAGTWVLGTSDLITLDTVYDSELLKESNDFTALFTEEGWLMMKRFEDSRVITVPICGDGATHGGIDIACDGTYTTPAA